MATSRKGSTTPKDLKDDAGGLVAGGGPDLSGTAMPPSKPVSAKARSRPADGATAKAGSGDAPAQAKAVTKPRPKTPSKNAGGAGAGSLADTGTTGLAGASEGSVGATAQPGAAAGTSAGRDTAGGATGERMSDEERQRRIAERAYRKAQERGFTGDRHLEDWLEAEREHKESEGR